MIRIQLQPMVHITSHASIWDVDSSQSITGETFCFATRRLVSENKANVSPPRTASNLRARSTASNPVYWKKSKNNNIFTAPPTPSGSSMWKVRAKIITPTEWGICGTRNRRVLKVRQKADSISALAQSFLRGATV